MVHTSLPIISYAGREARFHTLECERAGSGKGFLALRLLLVAERDFSPYGYCDAA
jgi:hypothetical protein